MKTTMTAKDYIMKRMGELNAQKDIIDAKLDELRIVLEGIEREEADEIAANKAAMERQAPF